MNNIKKDFPIFTNKPNLVYLDSAATSQKPQQVIDAVTQFYCYTNANVHRGIYQLAEEATEAYENARKTIAQFIHANKEREIVFTGNTNESINLVAYGWAKKYLQEGDVIVLSDMEHHANIVPWQRLAEEKKLTLHFLPITEDFRLDYQSILSANIDIKKIKLVSLIHASNVLGTVNPIKDIILFFKSQGVSAKFLVDAAQSVPHMPIDVQDIDCDFLVFSGHKMLGPTGIGVLYAKEELLENMDPLFVGSHMITKVTKEKSLWTEVPWKFEVGTGKLEAAVGLAAAVEYIQLIGFEKIIQHEKELTTYGLEQFQQIDGITLFGPTSLENRLGIFSFSFENIHPHDIAQILDREYIAIRSGHHCAQPLMNVLNLPATARASVYMYNSKEDIDRLVKGLEEVRRVFT